MASKLIAVTIASAFFAACSSRPSETTNPGYAGSASFPTFGTGTGTTDDMGGRDDVPATRGHMHSGVPVAGTAAPTTPATATAGTGSSRRPPATGTGGTRAPSATAGSGSAARSGTPTMVGTSAGVATVIASTSLDQPSDLEFNPYVPDELWVVNHGDSSAAIISNASTARRSVQRRQDPEGAQHFMPSPMAFAFGGRETSIQDAQGKMVEGTFATCPEDPSDGMGPSLWASDLRIFGLAKDVREPPFNGPDTGDEGPSSHIDMLHRTPACTGIAWEGTGNIYWTYSGTKGMFVRYDFAADHGIGNSYHSDASVWRYRVDGIGYVPEVPSHMAYDREHKQLYMVDTGHARVVVFDPAGASGSTRMSEGENLDHLRVALDMAPSQVTELIGKSVGLKKPSGVELHAGNLYVSDNETSTIYKFSLAGAPLAAVAIAEVAPGALAGITFGPDDKLYFVDMVNSRVLRLETAL